MPHERTHNPLVPGSSPGGLTTTSLDRLDSALGLIRGNGEVAIEAGQQLLHYRLIEKIGEGGMGVVWEAVDTTLDREVAIKILPDAFSKDADRFGPLRARGEAVGLAE